MKGHRGVDNVWFEPKVPDAARATNGGFQSVLTRNGQYCRISSLHEPMVGVLAKTMGSGSEPVRVDGVGTDIDTHDCGNRAIAPWLCSHIRSADLFFLLLVDRRSDIKTRHAQAS